MREPILIAVSAALFVGSLLVFALLQFPDRWEVVPFQWWLHVALLLVLFLGFWQLHRLRKVRADQPFGFLRGFPLWLIPLGLVAVAVAVPIWSPSRFDLGTTPQGERVHRKSTFEQDGKYFVRLNDKYVHEISRDEYLAFDREGQESFARGWVLGSYLAMAFWHYLWRRRRALEKAG
jgi:energy-coupling factor transporter transmembrane protein EcfT